MNAESLLALVRLQAGANERILTAAERLVNDGKRGCVRFCSWAFRAAPGATERT
jgi:hypothetical protein